MEGPAVAINSEQYQTRRQRRILKLLQQLRSRTERLTDVLGILSGYLQQSPVAVGGSDGDT